MSKRWKRPSRVEMARIRAECGERGISVERVERMIVDARRSAEEAKRHAQAEVARLEAEGAELPTRTPEELHTWYEEYRGYRPPRKLPSEAAAYLPGWIQDYRKRKPFAPQPWFWIAPDNDSSAAWDGRCFVRSGWEEVEPLPRRYHEAWEMGLLYPSAVECLHAAEQISAATRTDCEVRAHPAEAYYPPRESPDGRMYDLLQLRGWVRLIVRCANSHFNAGLDPLTPLDDWIIRGYLPHGTAYPANGLSFWHPDCPRQLWDRLRRESAPPTYIEILDRRADRPHEE